MYKKDQSKVRIETITVDNVLSVDTYCENLFGRDSVSFFSVR